MARYLEGLTAVHDLANIALLRNRFGAPWGQLAEAVAAERWARHPVVRTHPETGEEGLFVNPTYTRFIDGLPPDEGDMVLSFLYRHQVKEQFTYRHRWAPGDLLIWDNRATMHIALNDFDGAVNHTSDEVREALALSADTPILRVDARGRDSAKSGLIALVKHALAKVNAAA